VQSPFSRLGAVVAELGLAGSIDGVLLDLGVSSPQLDEPARGFSFAQDGPLDMRMDPGAGSPAADFIAKASEREIARVIREYGEERFAKRIAREIVTARRVEPIERTSQLAEIVARAVPTREPGKHPATRTFQAIRIHVNDELREIEAALNGALSVLATGGRLCVISFHSLEDGLVKRFMQKHSVEDPVYAGLPEVPPHARPKLRRVGRAIHPSEQEIASNPRARSAILRVAERTAA
ncbi:MAG TPA: 16S rRNA (cytosine(1402)-N(4))-methyltransferase RsmH, partial [Steroidobacter sp.]